MKPLISLVWTSIDISSGFQSRGGQPYSDLAESCVYVIPGVTTADLLAASMAAETFSSIYLGASVGRARNQNLWIDLNSCIIILVNFPSWLTEFPFHSGKTPMILLRVSNWCRPVIDWELWVSRLVIDSFSINAAEWHSLNVQSVFILWKHLRNIMINCQSARFLWRKRYQLRWKVMHFPILNDQINLIQPIGQPFFSKFFSKKIISVLLNF